MGAPQLEHLVRGMFLIALWERLIPLRDLVIRLLGDAIFVPLSLFRLFYGGILKF